ncbi:MAG: AraC family transcriptional regulator [Lachnospiraceae bacterium]|nr:AraC family transcriptional regulator [Lachnospiraceae bacterium]
MNKKHSLKENIPHGTSVTPIDGMEFRESFPNRFFVERHWHPEMEILYVDQGEFEVEIDLEQYHLRPGDFCFINSENLHQINGLSSPSHHYAFLFATEILDYSYHDILEEELIRPFVLRTKAVKHILSPKDDAYKHLAPLLHQMFTASLEQKKNWYLTCKLLLLQFLSTLSDTSYFQNADSLLTASERQKIDRYKSISSYIDEHYAENISLQDLADHVSCNSQYLCRMFREMTGTSPIQFLICRRIDFACILLKETTKSIMEISLDCGFDNVSYFIRKFRQVKACTPSQYRKQAF